MAESGGPFAVNADIQILDEDGNLLHESWLGRGEYLIRNGRRFTTMSLMPYRDMMP